MPPRLIAEGYHGKLKLAKEKKKQKQKNFLLPQEEIVARLISPHAKKKRDKNSLMCSICMRWISNVSIKALAHVHKSATC